MIKIFHNPRCRKSREGLQILEENVQNFDIQYYLKDTLTYLEILELLKKLGIKPIELVRTNENIWKEKYKGKELTDEQIVEALAAHPKLIERPIVVKEDKAVIGRPASKIEELLKSQ